MYLKKLLLEEICTKIKTLITNDKLMYHKGITMWEWGGRVAQVYKPHSWEAEAGLSSKAVRMRLC